MASPLALLAGCGDSSATLQQLVVSPASATVPMGETVQLSVSGRYSNGSTQSLNGLVSWSTAAAAGSDARASINAYGALTAPGQASSGTLIVTATCNVASVCGAMSATASVIVTWPVITSVSIGPAPLSMVPGQTQQFVVWATDSTGSQSEVGASSWSSDNPSVLSFNAASSLGSNTATAAAVGSAHISATVQGTALVPAPLLVTVTNRPAAAPVGFAYVNTAGGYFGYGIGADGELTPLSPPQASANGQLTLDASSGQLIAAAGSQVVPYQINADGSLAQLPSSLPPLQPNSGLYIGPQGGYAYAENIQQAPAGTQLYLTSFLINADSTFTQIGTLNLGPFTADGDYGSLIFDSAGAYAYLAEGSAYQEFSTVPSGGNPVSLGVVNVPTGSACCVSSKALVSNGTNGYIAYQLSSGQSTYVAQYAVSGGVFSLVNALAANIPTSTVSEGMMALDRSGQYLYVVSTAGVVYQFGVAADGSLTALSPASVPTGHGPVGIQFDPTGRYVYVPNAADGSISQYAIGTNGALTPLASPIVGAYADPVGIITVAAP